MVRPRCLESVGPEWYFRAGVITDPERQVLELVGGRGFSQRQAASALGVSRSSVRSRLESAVRKIAVFEGRAA